MAKKYCYLFTEGNAKMREILGGKGANLAEMTNIGLPVPQGFTISTEACTQYYEDGKQINPDIQAEIMEYIEKEYADVDGIYLFANDTVVDYYPRFGFRPAAEYAYRKDVSQTGGNRAEQIPMDNAESWSKLAAAMEKSEFREGCRMVDNPGLIFFYVSQFMQEAVYYIPHLDAWIIAEQEDGVLTIHNIFADEKVTIDDVVAAFGAEVKQIALGFAPEKAEGWQIERLREEDTHVFVKGAVCAEFETKKLRIPSLSHA